MQQERTRQDERYEVDEVKDQRVRKRGGMGQVIGPQRDQSGPLENAHGGWR
jgi:hypothetical protein